MRARRAVAGVDAAVARAAAVSVACSVVLSAACGPADEAVRLEALPVLTLAEPSLEIGVLEGDDELVFAAIESVVRLPDGRIAVSDAGATRISIFDAQGAFVRSWGSQGDGPGEFRSLSRIYPLGADSLMAAERFSGRLTVFDLQGGMGRLQPGAEISGDSAFTLDSWLSGRFWIEGALTRAERARATAILERLTVPSDWPGYRLALATDEGGVWIREPRAGGETRTWTRVGVDGPDAVITTPTAFRPTDVRADEVLGVWSDESGVHFVRAYRPVRTGETAEAPAWLASGSRPDGPAPTDGAPTTEPTTAAEAPTAEGPVAEAATEEALRERALAEQELMDEVRTAIIGLARAQEIHYSSAMSYTAEIDSLESFEPPEAIHIDVLRGDARGWISVFTHPGLERVCGLAYGFGIPPGWTPGAILCGPEADAAVTTAAADRTRS